jgi:hypothetical protein
VLKKLGRAAATAIGLLVAIPAVAGGREVTCESRHMRHEYCPIGNHGSVRVMTAYGRHPCEEGRTWGTDSSGIWVDQGCYARFWVEDKSSRSNKNAAIAAGAVGAAALVAILASHKRDRDNDPPPPAGWTPANPPTTYSNTAYSAPNALIGRFHGYNTTYRADITVDIDPSGRVTYWGGGERVTGRLSGNRIYYDNGTSYTMEQTGSGFVLREDSNAGNAVAFSRVR